MCLYKYWLNVHVVEKKIPLWCGYYHHSINKWQFYYLLSALKPTEFERKRALISAVCEILWKAGDGKRCCVCLLQDKRSYPQDHRLRDDDVTEFVRLLTDSETTAPLYILTCKKKMYYLNKTCHKNWSNFKCITTGNTLESSFQ